jgi:hypothetical protein
MRMSEFDLAILSAWLSNEEQGRILSAAGDTPILVLTELTLAKDLLVKVERMLDKARDMGLWQPRDINGRSNI